MSKSKETSFEKGTLTRGLTIRYPKGANVDDWLKKVLLEHPSHSLVNFRPEDDFQIKNSSIHPKTIFSMTNHEVSAIKKDGLTVEGLTRISISSKSELQYKDFDGKDNTIDDWRKSMEEVSEGKITSFSYAINIRAKTYIKGLQFEGVFDLRNIEEDVLKRRWPDEEVEQAPQKHAGIRIPTLYVGRAGDAFVIHVEDGLFSSINTLLKGKKVWVALAKRSETDRAFKLLGALAGDACYNPYLKKCYFPSIQLLLDNGFDLIYVIQEEGDTIYTLPMGPHFGISLTHTVAIAKNCADDHDWVAVAMMYASERIYCNPMKIARNKALQSNANNEKTRHMKTDIEKSSKRVRNINKIESTPNKRKQHGNSRVSNKDNHVKIYEGEDDELEELTECDASNHLTAIDVMDIITYIKSKEEMENIRMGRNPLPIRWNLTLHAKPPVANKPFKCEECKTVYETKRNLERHQSTITTCYRFKSVTDDV